ncbi:MAG: hypothetical protein KDC93_17425 [Cyclobacteriaceae bacterium]|jgi:hypothetical protein|nr:hypothetical protein [Cyclobacteriaceae bacterium]
MEIVAMDNALQEIIAKRNLLQKLDYNNPKYDDLEEELHDMEDDFQDNYGEYLEKVLQQVHDQHCPDTDVLHPIAYIAKAYTVSSNNEFILDSSDGLYVEMDKYPGKETKLALAPNPMRVILNIGEEKQEVIWSAK